MSDTPDPGQSNHRTGDPRLAAVTDYLESVWGPEDAERLAPTVLAALRPDEEWSAVGAAVRAVALERLRATRRLHRGCVRASELLHRRRDGAISTGDLRWLYGHLDRCHTCGPFAERLDAADWDLEIALAAPGVLPEIGLAPQAGEALVPAAEAPPPAPEQTEDAPAAAAAPPVDGGPELPPESTPEAPSPAEVPAAPLLAFEPEPARELPVDPAAELPVEPAPQAEPEPAPELPDEAAAELPDEPAAELPPEPDPRPEPAEIAREPVRVAAPDPDSDPTDRTPDPAPRLEPASSQPLDQPAPDRARDLPDEPAHPPILWPADRPDEGPAQPVLEGRRRSRSSGRLTAVLLVVLASAAGVGGAFLLGIAGTTGSEQPTMPTVVANQAPPAGTTVVRTTREPFEADGARWAVFSNPAQPWVTRASQITPATGRAWHFVEVLVRNLQRAEFVPCGLHYRLEDSARSIYFPDRRVGTTVRPRPPAAPLPAGAQAECRLAFQVPTGLTGLRLVFDPLTTPGRYEIPL